MTCEETLNAIYADVAKIIASLSALETKVSSIENEIVKLNTMIGGE